MSTITAFPRDLPAAEAAPAGESIDIVVRGVVAGSVDPSTLTVRAQLDLERVRGALDLLGWLQRYAGVTAERARDLEDELGEMPLRAIRELAEAIGRALGEAVAIPKPSGRR